MSPLRVDLSSFDNSWYNPGPKWKIVLWFLLNPIFVNSYLPLPIALKVLVLKLFGATIGRGFVIKPAVNIKYPWKFTAGDHVWVGEGVWIDNLAPVTLQSHSCVSQGALLLTGNHDYRRRSFDLVIKPIRVEEGAWVGAKAIVCPGVTCRSHAVLAVGSVATRDLEPYGIYQGNPAVLVRKREIEA